MKPKLFIFALLALLVASCTDEIDIPEPAAKEEKAPKAGEMVTIEASIPPETRVAYDDSDGSLSWQSGDQLRLAAYNGILILEALYLPGPEPAILFRGRW